MARPVDIEATYKGEWIVTERVFSVKVGQKIYSWSIEAEVPAMRYSVDGGQYELGPADWVPESGSLNVKLQKPVEKGVMRDVLSDIGFNAVSFFAANAFVTHALVATAVVSDPTMVTAATLGTKFIAYHGARLTASYAMARRKAVIKALKRAPMPGWPAINFRGGKKAKAKATKKASQTEAPFELKAVRDVEAVASFEMADGSVKSLKAYGLSAALYVDDDQVWATESLYVPMEPGTKVPAEAYAVAYAVALATEAVAYHSKFVIEPVAESRAGFWTLIEG